MEQIGVSLIRNGSEIAFWGDTPGIRAETPNVIVLDNGDRVHCPQVGTSYGSQKLVPRMFEYANEPSLTVQNDQVVVKRRPPEPGTLPPRLVASALSIEVANSDVASIAGAFNLVAAVYLDIGQYMLLFMTPLADANYFAVINGGAATFSIVDQTQDYLIVQASIGDAPQDPARFSVQIYTMEQ